MNPENIPVEWPRRYKTAFLIGIVLDLYKRSYEPNTGGPGAILVFPFAVWVSLLMVFSCAIAGLPLKMGRLHRLWTSTLIPSLLLILVSGLYFQWGIVEAHTAFFENHRDAATADSILWRKAIPGFAGIIFAVLHWPYSCDIMWPPKPAADETKNALTKSPNFPALPL